MPDNLKFDALMHAVCVEQGWCGGVANGKASQVEDYIPHAGPVGADQFVDWLFAAEGYRPASEPERAKAHREVLRALFLQHMGAETVDASTLKREGF